MEQKEALRKLFTGSSPHAMGQPVEVKEIAIKFENLDAFGQAGKTTSGTMGQIAKVEVTPIAGVTDPNKPMVVENGAEPGSKWNALGESSNSFYRSAGKDYKFDGTSGESQKICMERRRREVKSPNERVTSQRRCADGIKFPSSCLLLS